MWCSAIVYGLATEKPDHSHIFLPTIISLLTRPYRVAYCGKAQEMHQRCKIFFHIALTIRRGYSLYCLLPFTSRSRISHLQSSVKSACFLCPSCMYMYITMKSVSAHEIELVYVILVVKISIYYINSRILCLSVCVCL